MKIEVGKIYKAKKGIYLHMGANVLIEDIWESDYVTTYKITNINESKFVSFVEVDYSVPKVLPYSEMNIELFEFMFEEVEDD